MPNRSEQLADEPPWTEGLTSYDEVHFTLYMRLLDAVAAKATDGEICEVLLGIDAKREPERAERCLQSHLKRARWFTKEGLRYLVDRDVPAPEGARR